MKKILLILLSFFFVACTQESHSAQDILDDFQRDNYPNSVILCEQFKDNYYFCMLKEENQIILVILEKTETSYEYYGSSSYECSTVQDYGKFYYENHETSMTVIFSENTEKYNQLLLEFNSTNEAETLNITVDLDIEHYILNVTILPSTYYLSETKLEKEEIPNN